MFGCERLAVVGVNQQAFSVEDVFCGHVCGVSAVTVRHQVAVGRVDSGVFQERVDRYASPVGVEFRPLGDTVEVGVNIGLRQGVQRVPRPATCGFSVDIDGEIPCSGVDSRRWAGRQYGEAIFQILTRRYGPWRLGSTSSEEFIVDQVLTCSPNL